MYRIESTRHPSWDYSKAGSYFITICIKDRSPSFGHINNEIMCLSEIGSIADEFWLKIPELNNHIRLGQHVVMPDHIHGILNIINGNAKTTGEMPHDDKDVALTNDDKDVALQRLYMSNISPKSGSISTIIRSYKSAVSKHARKIDASFKWLPGFHDKIIWDHRTLSTIERYIIDNPKKWVNK